MAVAAPVEVEVLSMTPHEVTTLANRINFEHHQAEAKAGEALLHAKRCGELLTEAKEQVKHGEWVPWLEAKFEGSRVTAWRYMRLAEGWDELRANVSPGKHLPLKDAIKLLSDSDHNLNPLLSTSNEWYTPSRYIEAARQAMGAIDLDPASNDTAQSVIQATTYYTIDDNGLEKLWAGRVWLNPPWGREAPSFVEKMLSEYDSGHIEKAILLLNSNSTDSGWFQPLWDHTLCFTDHRIDFEHPETKATSSTHGSVFVYLGSNTDRFVKEFAKFGPIVRRVA